MIPYLRDSELQEGMTERPDKPFFVRPADYKVVDGDTLRILAPMKDGRRPEAFRIRFDSVNAGEKPVRTANDEALRMAGIDPHSGSEGAIAKRLMTELCKGRALFVAPVAQPDGDLCDRHGRLLANVWVSGSPNRSFDPEGARSAENFLFERNLANVMKGRALPPQTAPQIAAALAEREGQAVSLDF